VERRYIGGSVGNMPYKGILKKGTTLERKKTLYSSSLLLLGIGLVRRAEKKEIC